MKRIWIFDIDGTLTRAREPMSKEIGDRLIELSCVRDDGVFLVTGSDWPKVQEQVDHTVRIGVDGIFACSGAELYMWDTRVYTTGVPVMSKAMHTFLEVKLDSSEWPRFLRSDPHIEFRPGCVNFSVVGRGASPENRDAYHKFDVATRERELLTQAFNDLFPDWEARIGGRISVDLSPRGQNKSMVYRSVAALAHSVGTPEICFVGDMMEVSGNDYPLMTALDQYPKRSTFPVKSVDDTIKILEAACQE